MEQRVYALVSCLADNYGFDADEAFEYVRWETDVDHVGELLKMTDTMKPATKKAMPVQDDETAKKIAECKKNITLWEKKLKDGKVKDADKQREKIEKEKAKLTKLEGKVVDSAPAVVETKPSVEPEKKEKRIKRFSPVMASQLKLALEKHGLTMDDKLKKEFQQYIEDLSDDAYRKDGLSDHMYNFGKQKVGPKTVPEEVPPPPVIEKPTIVDVSLKELQSISLITEIETPGTYFDGDSGRFVKGPDVDEDEDFNEVTFEGTAYVVGERTGRVYEARETGDVFAGFLGIGKFKTLTVPSE